MYRAAWSILMGTHAAANPRAMGAGLRKTTDLAEAFAEATPPATGAGRLHKKWCSPSGHPRGGDVVAIPGQARILI